ncbi:hypothetical protein LMG26696_02916 [Achromobacter pulmonis]|nr:hypothetical protein LMG26696_02916 [Achromobacter pulmonis]
MWRRLFQRLEHRVERVPRQHVHFVDHVDLEAARARRIDGLLQQLGHFLDAAVRGRVQFEVIDEPAGVDLGAGATDAAGLGGDAGFAVERFGQDARQRGLADAAGAGEQPGVMQALGVERMRQRAHHVILSHEGIERSRPPLAGQYQISHGGIVEPLQEPMRLPARNAKGTESFSGESPLENNPVPFEKPVGEPYSGTDPKRLWLLRSRPDQVHRRTMRRGPPSKILAELRVARSASLLLGGPRGAVCAPPPRPSPRGGGGEDVASLVLVARFALPCLPCLPCCLACLAALLGLLSCCLTWLAVLPILLSCGLSCLSPGWVCFV